MKVVPDFVCSVFRLLGLLEEPPLIRKNFKRNRVYDDWSSDEETPEVKLRKSNGPTIGSPKKDNPRLTKNGSILAMRSSFTDDDDEELDTIKAAYLESKKSKNTTKGPSIMNVALDDNDSSNDQDDDVVFVKEGTSPSKRALEQFLTKKYNTTELNDKVISDILKEIKSFNNLNATSITMKPASKRKPVGNDELAKELFIMPQKKQINDLNKIDNALNSDRYENSRDHRHIRLSSTDSSDSDVEVVPPKTTTSSFMRKNVNQDIADKSRNWLLELGSKHNLQKNQDNKNFDVHPLSDNTSNTNNKKNESRSSSSETFKDWLEKLDAKYSLTPRNTLENFNNQHQGFSIASEVNREQNQTDSHKPDTAGNGLTKLESNNNGRLRLQNTTLEFNTASEVKTDQNEVQSVKLGDIKDWLAKLDSTYCSTPQKTQGDIQEWNVVPKVNSKQDCVDVPRSSLNAETERKTDLHKTLEKLVDARRSDIHKRNKEENEARSYLPSSSREWLSKLDSEYKPTVEKSQEILFNARQKLNSLSKVNSQQNEVQSPELNSSVDWLSELESKYKTDVQNTQQKPPQVRRESASSPRVYSNRTLQNKTTKEQGPSKLDSKIKAMLLNREEKCSDDQDEVNLSNVNSRIENSTRSFKFNTSEDLLLKLGSLYDKDRPAAREKNDNTFLKADYVDLENEEMSEPDSIVVEIQDDLPQLTAAQEKLVDSALEPEPSEELLVEKFNIKIHRRDLQTLSDSNWLNDEVINFYMNLIMQRSEERADLPSVYATNTFFYTKLMQSGHAGLRRWTRKVDIFSYDLFMVPVNLGNHWCLSLVDFRARMIVYLDSKGMPNRPCLDALMQYLKDEHQDKKASPFNDSIWDTKCLKDIPQQMNGSDCGMFACTFAEFSARDAPYSFTQAHMPYLRRKAALEILGAKLLL